ncbi:MAG: glycosyltransferase family 4 protein [Candidatus Rokubacteria bacterium]|nr:glycosyltransferase family 4 protein [Candidatus Rokubacteria bacterium]
MNILLVTPFQLTDVGGVSTAVVSLMREFEKRGHRTSVLVPGEGHGMRRRVDGCGRTVHAMYLRPPYCPAAVLRGLVGFCLFFGLTLWQLARLVRRERIDVVAVQYPLPWVFYFAVLRCVSSFQLVVTYQGSDAHDLSRWSPIDRQLVGFLLARADSVTAVSQSLLDEVAAAFPRLRLAHTRLISNGAPFDLIPAADGSHAPPAAVAGDYVLFVGHLVHRKGLDVVLDALRFAHEQGCRLHLVVAGDGPERPALERQAAGAGLADHVHFAGNQAHPAIFDLYRGCLFFVLASRAEGRPLVIAEAMACGKAVVATKVDGIPEMVEDGRSGLLVDPDDPCALADAMIRLCRDAELRDAIGRRGQAVAEREYAWNGIATRYLEVFREVRAR